MVLVSPEEPFSIKYLLFLLWFLASSTPNAPLLPASELLAKYAGLLLALRNTSLGWRGKVMRTRHPHPPSPTPPNGGTEKAGHF